MALRGANAEKAKEIIAKARGFRRNEKRTRYRPVYGRWSYNIKCIQRETIDVDISVDIDGSILNAVEFCPRNFVSGSAQTAMGRSR